MTAFASNILAALPGFGARSGADGAVTADGKGAGGAFEALMATLNFGAATGPESQDPAATPASPTLAFASGVRAVTGLARDPAAQGLPVDAADAAEAATEAPGAADGLAAAAAVLVAPTPTASLKVATPDSRPQAAPAAIVASPRLAAQTVVDPAVGAEIADTGRPAVGQQIAPPPSPAPDAAANAAGSDASPSAGRVLVLPEGEQAPQAVAPAAVASPQSFSPDAVAEAPLAPPPAPPMGAAPRSATEALTSLIGRVLDGARRPENAAAVPPTVTEAAPPADAPVEVAVDAPVELTLEAALSPETPVAAEAAVVETPAAPVAAPGRRPTRADAARAEVTRVEGAVPAVESDTPEVKIAARADARAVVDVAPAPTARPEAAPLPAPLADLVTEPEPATLDTAAPAPTLQAAAELPVEAASTRGSPETVARLAADIVRKLEGQTTRFDVQLDPLGLGKVDVSIEINADGRLSASLSFDSAQTAADLRGRAGELRQALQNAGFDLADGGLSFDMNNPGGSGGREARETLAAWSSRAFETARTGLEQAEALAARSPWSRTPSGGVDIRI
jgi:flagellar hook-length control protein FliK